MYSQGTKNDKGRFIITKIEPESNQEPTDETDEEATDGIETVVEDETGPEEGEVVIIPILKPTKNVTAAQGHKSDTRNKMLRARRMPPQ